MVASLGLEQRPADMTIATKNGSVILKGGSVAQSCGCCGGWYCCPPAECALDVVNSVVVTITPAASEWVRKIRTRTRSCSGITAYDQRTLAIPTGSLSGTHSLTKSSSVLWSKTLEVDSVGCVSPVVSVQRQSFSGTSGSWRLNISYGSYYWYQKTTDGQSAFKNLSDMQCQSTPPWSGSPFAYCTAYSQGHEEYNASTRSILATRSFQCVATGTVSFNNTLSFSQPSFSTDERGPLPDPASTDTTTGSLQINVVVTIS